MPAEGISPASKPSVEPLLCSRLSPTSLRAEGAKAEAAEAEGRKLSPEADLIGSQ